MKIILSHLVLGGFMAVATGWPADVLEFRQGAEASIKKNWLVVVGLSWLKEGENSLGADAASFIVLPQSTPAHLGKIIFHKGKTELEFTNVENVKIDGVAAKKAFKYEMISDKSDKKTVVEIGSVQMYLIDRANGVGLRVKDSESDTLKNFKGLLWWPPEKKYVLTGRWKPINPPKILKVPDVQGKITDEKITGSVIFDFEGKEQELFPTREGNDLFFVFKDTTSGKTSYGTGRFLRAEVQADGKVQLDFNKATNPPCAQIKFATCPMAPVDNYLKVAIEAGEKSPPKH